MNILKIRIKTQLTPKTPLLIIVSLLSLNILLQTSSAQAKCNGWHARWCGDRYWREGENIKTNILPNLNTRSTVLPVQLSYRNQERDLINEMLRSSDREIGLLNTLINQDQEWLNLLQNQLIPATLKAEASINTLNSKIVSRLPVMIAYLRNFLTRQDHTLDLRLRELDQEIAALTDQSQLDALLYEKSRLENLRTYSQTFSTPEAFNQAIEDITAGRLDAKTAKLSMETMALIKEAASLKDLNVSSSEIFTSVRLGIQKLLNQLETEVSEKDTSVKTRQSELTQAIGRRQLTQTQYHHVNQTIASMAAELSSLPALIDHWNARLANVELYWNCCDNQPFCHLLPDADQSTEAYARFEASISRPHHEKGCRAGGNL